MYRRLYLLVFVLFFVAVEPTFGLGLFRHRRVRCPGPVMCEKPCCCKSFAASECFCIQYRVWDVPDTYIDFFHVLYYPDGCGGEEVEHYEDDLYYVSPQPMPQQCEGNEYPRCIGQAFGCGIVASKVPGYSSLPLPTPIALPDKSTAQKVLEKGFNGAGVTWTGIEFYKIPISKMTHIPDDASAKEIYIVIGTQPIKAGSMPLDDSPAGIPCFGLEMDYKPGETFVELKNNECQHATVRHTGDKQIRIIFKGPDNKNRVATIWLK